MKRENTNSGFTLIELSIVLVIISLIVGGVIGGKALIHSAELNSITIDVNRFKTAIHTFNLQYDALPGDFSEASSYWPTTCVDSGANTCDGNGDNIISGGGASREAWRVWQHLYLAGLIKDAMTGGSNFYVAENSPESKLNGAAFAFYYGSDNSYYPSSHNIKMGSYELGGIYGAILKPKDAYLIDKKSDDGLAIRGTVMSGRAGGVGVPANCNSGANYLLSINETSCRIFFEVN